MGSTVAARRIGTQQASRATSTNNNPTEANVESGAKTDVLQERIKIHVDLDAGAAKPLSGKADRRYFR